VRFDVFMQVAELGRYDASGFVRPKRFPNASFATPVPQAADFGFGTSFRDFGSAAFLSQEAS
jgi:hypothetical protein